jgi:hypothetical protein
LAGQCQIKNPEFLGRLIGQAKDNTSSGLLAQVIVQVETLKETLTDIVRQIRMLRWTMHKFDRPLGCV